MSNIKQKFLSTDNTQNGIFYPITDVNSVYDENGNSLKGINRNLSMLYYGDPDVVPADQNNFLMKSIRNSNDYEITGFTNINDFLKKNEIFYFPYNYIDSKGTNHKITGIQLSIRARSELEALTQNFEDDFITFIFPKTFRYSLSDEIEWLKEHHIICEYSGDNNYKGHLTKIGTWYYDTNKIIVSCQFESQQISSNGNSTITLTLSPSADFGVKSVQNNESNTFIILQKHITIIDENNLPSFADLTITEENEYTIQVPANTTKVYGYFTYLTTASNAVVFE